MATHDLIRNIKHAQAINPATITATTNGIVIDSQGYRSLTFIINVGIFVDFTATNKWTFTVEESDASDGTGMAEIASGNYLAAYKGTTSGWDRICDAAADDESTFAIGVIISLKRYYRLVLTEGGTVSAIVGAEAVLGHPIDAPVGATV